MLSAISIPFVNMSQKSIKSFAGQYCALHLARLYSFFCSLGSQYSMNSLYSFLFSPIFGRTFSKNASASQPFTTYPFDQSYSVLSVDSQKIYLYDFPLALSVSFPPGSAVTCHSPLPSGIDCVNRPSVSVSLTVTSVVFVGYRYITDSHQCITLAPIIVDLPMSSYELHVHDFARIA